MPASHDAREEIAEVSWARDATRRARPGKWTEKCRKSRGHAPAREEEDTMLAKIDVPEDMVHRLRDNTEYQADVERILHWVREAVGGLYTPEENEALAREAAREEPADPDATREDG
jgi:hypothetical protein